MFKTNKSIILDYSECPDTKDFINFNFKDIKLNKKNPALRIYFKNDIAHNTRILRKLIELKNDGYSFCSIINNKKVNYIISNYNDEVIDAFKALDIEDEKDRISFLYDTICKQLTDIWHHLNPCGFCDNVCVGNTHKQSPREINGCCYSFEYPKHPLFSKEFITNIEPCKYFDNEKKRCSIQNISCLLFVCNYVKKTTSFDININDFLLIQAFFTKKQKLILGHGYFRTKDEIIDKLLEPNNMPYWLYYSKSSYRIPKPHKKYDKKGN